MLPVNHFPNVFSYLDPQYSDQLEEFEAVLKDVLYLQFPQPNERALIDIRWIEIRDQACRNAGLESWGEHVLAHESILKAEIGSVIEALDPTGYRPWPTENHPNHISEVFEHIFYPTDSVPDLTWNDISALFLERDPELSKQAREQVEGVFPRLLEQIDGKHPDKVTEALVAHVIGLYAFMMPEEGSWVSLLRNIDGTWQLVSYQIERIRLTDPTLTSSAYALGLTPVGNDKANPVLIYQGTANPIDEGALLGYMADLTPFHSVGELIYKQGRAAIHSFVNRSDKEVDVFGISLGGALAILTGEDFPDQTVIHAHAAPGKLPFSLSRLNGENIYHDNDVVVPTLGYFHPGLRLFRAITAEDPEKMRNFYRAHMLPPAGCAPTIILRVNTQYENERLFRKVWTVFHQAMALVLFTIMTVYILARYAFNQTLAFIVSKLSPPHDQPPKQL